MLIAAVLERAAAACSRRARSGARSPRRCDCVRRGNRGGIHISTRAARPWPPSAHSASVAHGPWCGAPIAVHSCLCSARFGIGWRRKRRRPTAKRQACTVGARSGAHLTVVRFWCDRRAKPLPKCLAGLLATLVVVLCSVGWQQQHQYCARQLCAKLSNREIFRDVLRCSEMF
eukprot:SAG31_NODE_96_length_25743_cov_56.175948_5_plen_173_part_00